MSQRALRKIIIWIIVLSGCKEEYIPVPDWGPQVTTADISAITETSVVCGGDIISPGSTDIISKGLCWSTSTLATVHDNITINGSGMGSFSTKLTVLNPKTGYSIRAYAINYTDTSYGELKYFTTKSVVIPNDTLAFYVIEGLRWYNYYYLGEYTVDSIRRFKSKLIDHIDIVSYDTSRFVFDLNGESVKNVANLLIRSVSHYPLAAISKEKILFFATLSNPASSTWPEYYYLTPYYIFPYSTKGYLFFDAPLSSSPNAREENDIRLDSTMLKILGRYNKLR